MEHIFTFRGHRGGVTAIEQIERYLVSGDDEGSIIIWNIETFKCIRSYNNIVPSRIQSIRIISKEHRQISIIQSRDHGLHIYDIHTNTIDDSISLTLVDKLPSHPNLFSKGSAILHQSIRFVLGYPSEHSSQIITVRNLDDNCKTKTIIDIERPVVGGNVFDICLQTNPSINSNITCYAGYEDGKIGLYSLRCDELTNKFDIIMTRVINMKINDFVSAIDVYDNVYLVVGFPTRDLIIYNCDIDETIKLKLDKRGISSIRCRYDTGCIAVARWDSRVDIYKMDTKQILHSNSAHNKHIQDMIWINDTSFLPNFKDILCCVSLDGTISLMGT